MSKTMRVQFLASPAELERLDEWMFENELRGRSQALRCLILNRCGPDKMLFGRCNPENLEKSKEQMKDKIKEALDQNLSIWVDFLAIAEILGISRDNANESVIENEKFLEIWKCVKKWKNDLGCLVIKHGTKVQKVANFENSVKYVAYRGVIFFKDIEE